jgi:TetR/AcrR family transcriptional regulator, tetracycline repressor protein
MSEAPHPEPGAPRTGRPPRLTRSHVLAVARQIGARQGTEGLTMRRLAEALGVRPNALYTYFPDKAAILDAVLDDLLGDVERPRRGTSWRKGLIALMSSYRALLQSEPGLVPLTVSRPMIGPNALRMREDMLTLLRRGGLSDANAVSGYFALFAYTTGFVVFETSRVPGKTDTRQRAQTYELHAGLPDEDFPSTRALARRLRKRPGDAEFTRGLQGLVAGFAERARRS